MSKAFSKAIIDELRDVIREFKDKLADHIGDNFKQLNEALGNFWNGKINTVIMLRG